MSTPFTMIAPQLRCPSGEDGKKVGSIMDRMNDLQNDWVLSLLDLKATDTLLEVGFGTGRTLQKALRIITQGRVYGIELSETMFEEAALLLKQEISENRVHLSKGTAERLPYSNGEIKKIFAVHVVYFWENLDEVFRELYRVNSVGGITAIYFVSPIIEPSPYFHEYTVEEITHSLTHVGYSAIEIQRKKFDKQNGICMIARK